MDDKYVYIVLVSYAPMTMGGSDITCVLNVSYSEETAWAIIERELNDSIAKNKFGDPYIGIYPESRFIRVIIPMCGGCDGANIVYACRDYKIIRKPIVD